MSYNCHIKRRAKSFVPNLKLECLSQSRIHSPNSTCEYNTPEDHKNEFDEIFPNLILGEKPTQENLIKHNFTHVLSIIDSPLELTGFITKVVDIKDKHDSNIEEHFDSCTEFIHSALKEGGKIYVHCKMGISRSSTIVIAYIMQHGTPENPYSHTFEEAKNFVASKRPIICPNLGFCDALQNLEIRLKQTIISIEQISDCISEMSNSPFEKNNNVTFLQHNYGVYAFFSLALYYVSLCKS
jgi:protein-tyrosine phosphatase